LAFIVWVLCELRRVMPMRRSWVPSIVPDGTNEIVYLVLDDLDRHGKVYRETDADASLTQRSATLILAGHQVGNDRFEIGPGIARHRPRNRAPP